MKAIGDLIQANCVFVELTALHLNKFSLTQEVCLQDFRPVWLYIL
jgi:hypothetical protein